eukprot:5485297-Prymnesium_polylepis.1
MRTALGRAGIAPNQLVVRNTCFCPIWIDARKGEVVLDTSVTGAMLSRQRRATRITECCRSRRRVVCHM